MFRLIRRITEKSMYRKSERKLSYTRGQQICRFVYVCWCDLVIVWLCVCVLVCVVYRMHCLEVVLTILCTCSHVFLPPTVILTVGKRGGDLGAPMAEKIGNLNLVFVFVFWNLANKQKLKTSLPYIPNIATNTTWCKQTLPHYCFIGFG